MAQRVITCPGCGGSIEVPDNYLHARIKCPSCGNAVSRLGGAPQPQLAQPPMPVHQPVPAQYQPHGAQYPYPAQYAATATYIAPPKRSRVWLLAIIIPVVIVVGILALAAIPLIVSEPDFEDWPTHRSTAGQYEARFPRAPVEKTDSFQSALGLRMMHTATVTTRGRTFEVSWFDLGPGNESEYDFDYSAGAKGAADALRGSVASLESTTVSGHAGWVCRISPGSAGVNGKYYLLRVGNRVYIVGVAFTSANDPDVDLFLDNFRVASKSK